MPLEPGMVSGKYAADNEIPESITRYERDYSASALFQTNAVQAGDQTLFDRNQATSPWVVKGNTAQRLLDPTVGLVEHLQATGEGMEVTWVLQARPSTSGALQVSSVLEGLHYAGADAAGHHFSDANGTPRLAISKAYLADSGGNKMEVPFSAGENGLTVTVSE